MSRVVHEIGRQTVIAPHVRVDPFFPGKITIGDGATVAAHSFVDRDVDPGEKVGATPIETL